MITIRIEPEGTELTYPKINTVLQLLNKLKLRPTDALVIRDGGLLTPDLPVRPGDALTVWLVGSRG